MVKDPPTLILVPTTCRACGLDVAEVTDPRRSAKNLPTWPTDLHRAGRSSFFSPHRCGGPRIVSRTFSVTPDLCEDCGSQVFRVGKGIAHWFADVANLDPSTEARTLRPHECPGHLTFGRHRLRHVDPEPDQLGPLPADVEPRAHAHARSSAERTQFRGPRRFRG